MSTPCVALGSPCTELASDPPISHSTRSLSSRAPTSSAIATGSCSSLGDAMLCAIHPSRQLAAQP